MKELIAVQPDFEIYVNTFGSPGNIDVDGVIRRRDWYGKMDVNVVEDGLVVDGTAPIAVLEFARYQMRYTEAYRPATSDRLYVRVLAKDIATVMTMALAWISERPLVTHNQHSEEELATFHKQLRAAEQQAWRAKHAQL